MTKIRDFVSGTILFIGFYIMYIISDKGNNLLKIIPFFILILTLVYLIGTRAKRDRRTRTGYKNNITPTPFLQKLKYSSYGFIAFIVSIILILITG